MKTLLIILTLLVGLNTSDAQVKNTATNLANGTAGILLNQFANNLKPESFLPSWNTQKTNWLNTTSKVTDAVGFAKSISSLAGFIKPEMFKKGFFLSAFQSVASKANNWTSSVGLLKTLESSLKPNAFNANWNKLRTNWLSGLLKIK